MKNPDHKPNSAEKAIKDYLDIRAKNDPQFAVSYAKPNKSIKECYNYILSEARKRGSAVCMTDEEVFGLAVHYYDEDDIKVTKDYTKQVKASTSKTDAPQVELSDKEKADARQQAIDEYKRQCLKEEVEKQVAKNAKTKAKPAMQECYSPSLFDFDDAPQE